MVKNIVPIIPIAAGPKRNTANQLAVNMLSWSSLVVPTVNALLNRESTAQHNSYQHPTTLQYPLKPTENLPKNILGTPQNPITISNSRHAELEFQNQLLQSNRNNPMTTHDTSQDFQAAQPLTQTPAQHS